MDHRYKRSWMWTEAVRMLDEADRLRQQFFRLQEQEQLGGVWEPPVDVYETEEKWTVVVALPGVPSERMRYRLDGNSLTVVAERAIPSECSEGAIRRKELPHGRFARQLQFRTAPVEVSQAVLKDGCLVLILRKPLS